jgi:hypothetical protein
MVYIKRANVKSYYSENKLYTCYPLKTLHHEARANRRNRDLSSRRDPPAGSECPSVHVKGVLRSCSLLAASAAAAGALVEPLNWCWDIVAGRAMRGARYFLILNARLEDQWPSLESG